MPRCGRGREAPFVIHTSGHLGPIDVVTVAGFRCTSTTRTFARVDFLFDPFPIVVEVSGRRGHATDGERARDAQRRNELQDVGRHVFEYTYDDVLRRSAHVVATMRARLSAAGWVP